MKRFFSYLMVMATLVLGGGKAMAQSVTIGGVIYTVSGDHAYVSGNDGTVTDVVILGAVTINDVEYLVTEIVANAFSDQSSLVSVTLPDGIVTIGNSAFESCPNLTSINMGKGVVSIGDFAFAYCRKLTNIVLPGGLKKIGSYTFSTCEGFTDIQVPDGVSEFGGCVFEYCYNLKSITLPKGLTILPGHTFWQCRSLESILIPEGITTIELETFYDCGSLSVVVLPSTLTNIDSGAFWGCSSLQKVINNSSLPIEKGSTDYGYVAYYAQEIVRGDTCLNNFWFYTDENGVHHLTYYEGTDSIIILPADYLGSNYCINDNVFSGHDEIVSIQIPETVTSIGENTFSGCMGLPIENGIRYADSYAVEVTDKTLTEYTLKDNVRFLGNELFRNCSAMTSVNIPSGVTSIGENTFYGCSALTSLVLPETVASIGENTFYGCSALTSLVLPETVASIGEQAFYNCSSLTSVNVPLGVTSIGDNTFYGCTSLTSLVLPETVAVIGTQAFYNCSSLTSVNIPSGVTAINDRTFENCSTLTSLTLPSSVSSIGQYAFSRCKELKDFIFSENLKKIGTWAFAACESLKEIILPSNVNVIEADAFRDCLSLERLSLPQGITYIDSWIYNCPNLDVLELHSAVTGSDWFNTANYHTKIEYKLICHSETPPNVGDLISENVIIYAPEGCYAIYKESFPDYIVIDGDVNMIDVTLKSPGTLGEEILSQVSYLREVNSLKISGRLDDADIDCINNSLINLVDLDLSDVDMKTFSGLGHSNIQSIVLPKNCKSVGGLNHHLNLRSVMLPDSVEVINSSCFAGCKHLSEVIIPANLRSIGSNAFNGCNRLQNIKLSENLTSIGESAFMDCSSLKEINLPDKMNFIGSHAFQRCKSLKSVIVPSGVKVINNDTFNGCHALASVMLPDSLTTIATSTFVDCYSLSLIDIPSTVTSIGAHAFTNCSSLQSVSLPEGLSVIGITTFAHCSSLKEVFLPTTLKFCDYSAFFDTDSLERVFCPAFFPPTTGGDLIGVNNCTLYVPEWTLNRYKLANNWNLFASIEPISGIYPNSISVYTEESLTIPAEGLAADYKPNMEIVRYDNSNIGRFTVRGEGTLPLSSFKMQQTRDANTMTSLVNYGTLTADNVVTNIDISTNTWHFLTFPYDVKISDIVTEGNWVISRYDGAARAKEDFGNTWKTLPYDSILHAGEGYIWHSQGGNFNVPAMDNENKNLIFANDTRYIQLKENPAATEANYGWNLIGNPYPCYYDTRYMQFSSPITVRSGDSYAAYSPVDDSYILSPLEAFFVQCSAENNIVSFDTEGRQTDNSVRTLSYAPARTRAMGNERSVLNLYLESNAYADHTRLVVNEDASLAYEIACDAAKFMSDDAAVSQLFTIEGGERMAINERPLANGKAVLGVYIGKAGSYTLSLDTKAMDTEVFLVDKLLGTETDLTTSSYAFTAEAGTFTDRFEIRLKRTGVVDGIEAVAAELKVEATADGISVSNATTPIYIYSATGALVDTKVGSAVTFDVPQGVYVVKVGDNVHKVVVK